MSRASWLVFMAGAGTGILADRMVGRAKRNRVRRLIDAAVRDVAPAPAPPRNAPLQLVEDATDPDWIDWRAA